jgi:hypothetical protein
MVGQFSCTRTPDCPNDTDNTVLEDGTPVNPTDSAWMGSADCGKHGGEDVSLDAWGDTDMPVEGDDDAPIDDVDFDPADNYYDPYTDFEDDTPLNDVYTLLVPSGTRFKFSFKVLD